MITPTFVREICQEQAAFTRTGRFQKAQNLDICLTIALVRLPQNTVTPMLLKLVERPFQDILHFRRESQLVITY
jgi:hypothetical protein